ncbi:hypothetical protein [Litoreibacter arenae]|uniref:Uncharacterized protein n=1 Tax=Litoreibacter arenae DSM 19593 TaxID=1123360 RepID=S9QD32_9RHOB|nr:hypothetical protein [Litoreibacter arenae]EPX79346.1 hypothetical protein thalar_02171 [Litoreibacter arenae DSM 19593]
MKKRNIISRDRAKDLLIEMYQEEETRIDVKAIGNRAEVAVGAFDGLWHDFGDVYPTVDELIEAVNEAYAADLELSNEEA